MLSTNLQLQTQLKDEIAAHLKVCLCGNATSSFQYENYHLCSDACYDMLSCLQTQEEHKALLQRQEQDLQTLSSTKEALAHEMEKNAALHAQVAGLTSELNSWCQGNGVGSGEGKVNLPRTSGESLGDMEELEQERDALKREIDETDEALRVSPLFWVWRRSIENEKLAP